jgi:hypothetical protein
MSEFTSRRKRSRQSPASTTDYYTEGPPKTSGRGHQGAGKLRRNGHLGVTDFSFDNGQGKANFSEAIDSLGHLEEMTTKKEKYNKKIEEIKQRSHHLLQTENRHRPRESKRKKTKDTEDPLQSVLREQQEASSRRDYRTSSLSSRKKKDDFFETESDDEVQEVPKKYSAQLKLVRDKQVRATSMDMNTPIPKKKTLGRKEIFQERESNTMLNDDFKTKDSYCSIDVSSVNETSTQRKHTESRKGSSSTAVDLCTEGETDSEDNNANHSERDRDRFRATKKANAFEQSTGKTTLTASTEEPTIMQTLDAIKNDKTFVPSMALTLSKAPSSSEGRKIKETFASSEATAGTKRKSFGRAVEVPTSLFKSKKSAKSANAGRLIVPGASLQTNNARSGSDRSLELRKKRTESRASQESIKSYTTSKGPSIWDELSQDSCASSAKLRTNDKSAARKTKNHKEDDLFDDLSSATSVAVEKRSSRSRDIPRTLYRTRSCTRRSSISDSGLTKQKKNDFVNMVDDDSDVEEVNSISC